MRERPVILLVDGNGALLQVVVICLRREGFDAVMAASPAEAWPLWQERAGEFDVVISGLRFDQGPNGIEFLGRLRQAKPALKVILSSGDNPLPHERQWLHTQQIPFLPKPYLPSILLGLINHCLEPARTPLLAQAPDASPVPLAKPVDITTPIP